MQCIFTYRNENVRDDEVYFIREQKVKPGAEASILSGHYVSVLSTYKAR